MVTRYAAMERGEYGIRVNSVSPGITDTRAVAALLDAPDTAAPFIARIPMGRVATASEAGDLRFQRLIRGWAEQVADEV
jgi:NAD(P)-dependent dehydrogenase (short-subunit alcohol dehydrogenase family)